MSDISASEPALESDDPVSHASLISLAYLSVLGREIEPEALESRVAAMDDGVTFAEQFVEIANSEEAIRRRRSATDPESPLAAANLIRQVYRSVVGRAVDAETLEARLRALESGFTFAEQFAEIANSEEALRRASNVALLQAPAGEARRAASSWDEKSVRSHASVVRSAYLALLRRPPLADEVTSWVDQFKAGLTIERFLDAVAESQEVEGAASKLGAELSDGEFLVEVAPIVFGRGLLPEEVQFWQRQLNEMEESREKFVRDRVRERLNKPTGPAPVHDGSAGPIMGTRRILTRDIWDERRAAVSNRPDSLDRDKIQAPKREGFQHTGVYKVSMIASLYRGGKFIRQFLDNISSQSLFDSAELIIVDADSPDNEEEVIRQYQIDFPNIIYHKVNYTIGIYEAWNLGVGLARAPYLTNTNVDDLRRLDSISLQAEMLDRNDDVDIVYQDFYYTLDGDLTFSEIEACGFKSDLPIVTACNLLSFNAPHNAPMWRARLHEELGLFDASYRSAGDHEFWLRCMTAGKMFRKINAPHVAYYQNPFGMSTNPHTRGPEESRRTLTDYSRRLIPTDLLRSRRDFRASLGGEDIGDAFGEGAAYYDIAQAALRQLGEERADDIEQEIE